MKTHRTRRSQLVLWQSACNEGEFIRQLLSLHKETVGERHVEGEDGVWRLEPAGGAMTDWSARWAVERVGTSTHTCLETQRGNMAVSCNSRRNHIDVSAWYGLARVKFPRDSSYSSWWWCCSRLKYLSNGCIEMHRSSWWCSCCRFPSDASRLILFWGFFCFFFKEMCWQLSERLPWNFVQKITSSSELITKNNFGLFLGYLKNCN